LIEWGVLPKTSEARRWTLAIALAAVPAAAALFARGIETPWTPSCPDYRQSGAPDAKAVLVEFSDFQCPACGAAAPLVEQLKARFGPRLRVLYKHRPWFEFHRWAKDAALSAECAGRQGKFWEMHDVLFARQGEWAPSEDAPARIEGYARSLGVDVKALRACVKDPATLESIQADIRDAQEHWVNATPTFFVNGKRFVGGKQLKIFGALDIERSAGS
jgi:protein-disulfide isomerase